MHLCAIVNRQMPWPLTCWEEEDLVELRCPEHGVVAVFSAGGAPLWVLQRTARDHLEEVHCVAVAPGG